MTAAKSRKLEPKKESAIKPYAWWTFEKGKETDRMGRFPVNNLSGGAKIEGGRLLLLERTAAALIAADREARSTRLQPGPKRRPCRPIRRPTG